MSRDAMVARSVLGTFGEAVTRWPLGEVDDAETVTAVVSWHSTDQAGQTSTGRQVRSQDREAEVQVGTLEISVDQEWHDTDVWLLTVGSETRRVLILRETGVDGGLRTLLFQRTKGIATSRSRQR